MISCGLSNELQSPYKPRYYSLLSQNGARPIGQRSVYSRYRDAVTADSPLCRRADHVRTRSGLRENDVSCQ
ncbi:hypothetical protein RRG08_023691 [Elysia crispata]|uniref:Uncharacterized protein n=1 Tax=Elysia crispata TaxID=231223 RepID=A0AAE1ALN9_9GAST|nr:hypothetical protein RRG08_023691 [Elysia crispata]